ncbi:MAG: transglutaminase-like domain-containing protein [Gemmatimonadota bacterium]|nr:transglutaminase-like domain-containing protein [Gemmatimonadota bacterium]
MNPGRTRVRAILSLLADPDDDIVDIVRRKLFSMGEPVVREVLDAAPGGSQAQREAGRILLCLREPPLETQFRNLHERAGGDVDLETASFTLAKLEYPALNIQRYRSRLNKMAGQLAPSIAPDDHPLRVIRTLNHYVHDLQGFRGQGNVPASPAASYMNRVLDRKTGLPISISALYLFLARRLELPVLGVGMPVHFILKYRTADAMEFLFDPYNRGQLLTANECAEYLSRFDVAFEPSMLRQSSDRQILTRMILNLRAAYRNQNDARKVDALERLARILLNRHPLQE